MSGEGAEAVSYRSGDWTAVIGPEVWLLVDAHPGDSLAQRAWGCARTDGGPAALERMVREEAEAAPRSFALVARARAGLVVLLSGEAVVEVGPRASSEMRCPAGVSVAEYRLAQSPPSLVLRGGTATEDDAFPIESGMARAAEVRLEWTGVDIDVEEVPRSDASPLEAVVVAAAEPVGVPALDPGATLLPSSMSTLPDLNENPAPAPPDPEEEPVIAGQAPPEDVAPEDGYDHLFGRTVSRTVEEAAVRPAEVAAPDPGAEPQLAPLPDAAPQTARAPGTAAPVPATSAPLAPQSAPVLPLLPPPAPAQAVRAASAGLIEAVPWASSGALAPSAVPASPAVPSLAAGLSSAPAPPVLQEEEALGLTVSRAAQRALIQQMADPSPIGPMVHAVRCPVRHPNPAHAGTCRVCGRPIDDQAPVTVPRPVLGRLRLSTGGEVTLDRGVLMGRGPTEGRQVGGERPHVVKLPSPGHDISRNHLEVRIDGWHVLVTDLNSTNGTLVTLPGRPPERLRPDQPTMIEPGTVVAMADDVTFTYEVG